MSWQEKTGFIYILNLINISSKKKAKPYSNWRFSLARNDGYEPGESTGNKTKLPVKASENTVIFHTN